MKSVMRGSGKSKPVQFPTSNGLKFHSLGITAKRYKFKLFKHDLKMGIIILKSKRFGEKECFYDDSDHSIVSKFKWRLKKGRNTFYAVTYIRLGVRKYLTNYGMHQLLMSPENGACTDHKNRNGIDNRRCNLRNSTIQQNNRNATKQRNNTTGYRGVDYNKNHKAFRARVNINRKSVYCRYFKTKEDAARAYNEAAVKHFGEYANLNVI